MEEIIMNTQAKIWDSFPNLVLTNKGLKVGDIVSFPEDLSKLIPKRIDVELGVHRCPCCGQVTGHGDTKFRLVYENDDYRIITHSQIVHLIPSLRYYSIEFIYRYLQVKSIFALVNNQ